MSRYHDDAVAACSRLGEAASTMTPLGALGPFGQWLGWPDWFFEGTEAEGADVPQSLTMRDDLTVTANLLKHGFGGMLIDQTLESKRLITGPIAALIARNAPTLGDALSSLCTLITSTNAFLSVHRVPSGDRVTYRISERVKLGSLLHFYATIRIILFFRTIERFLLSDVESCEVMLTLPRSEAGRLLLDEWQGATEYSAPRNALTIPAKWERMKNTDYDIGLWKLALTMLKAHMCDVDGADLHNEIRNYVLAVLREERRVPRLKEIAAREEVSVRTLNRKLAGLGVKYQEIADDARKSVVSALISRPSISLGEIAYAAGFSDISSFSRSFRLWYGKSPKVFRQQLKH